jgi:hypothetical protein
LIIPGGGLNSTISGLKRGDPFEPIEEFMALLTCGVRLTTESGHCLLVMSSRPNSQSKHGPPPPPLANPCRGRRSTGISAT